MSETTFGNAAVFFAGFGSAVAVFSLYASWRLLRLTLARPTQPDKEGK